METNPFEDPSNMNHSLEEQMPAADATPNQELQDSNPAAPEGPQATEAENLPNFFYPLDGQTFDDALEALDPQFEEEEEPSESDIIPGPEFEGEEDPPVSDIIPGPEWPALDEPFEDPDGGCEVEQAVNDSAEGPQMSVAAADPAAYREQATIAFTTAMVARGLIVPSTFQADGGTHRCDVQGASGEADGSYRFCLDAIPSGGFQNWKDGHGWQSWSFEFGPGALISPEKQNEMRKNAEALRKVRAAEEAEARKKTQEVAQAIWRRSLPCTEHPYLTKKGIEPHGARLVSSGFRKGHLVIPIQDSRGVIHSVQTIDADGEKHFLKNGRKQGCSFPIGKPKNTLFIAEGFVTAASIHEATGEAVLVAFDCGNLRAVAEALRAGYPDSPIVIAADDDYRTNGNPGMTKAIAAAEAVGGKVVFPDFGPERPEKATDFNDLHMFLGLDAVRECIERQLQDQTSTGDSLPEIMISDRKEHEVLTDAFNIFVGKKRIFVRGGQLVHISIPHTGILALESACPTIVPATPPWMRLELSRTADFIRINEKGVRSRALVPSYASELALEMVDFPGLAHLHTLVETPILLPDGSIHTTPGFDPATGVYCVPIAETPALINEPTLDDARSASAALLDLVTDFPFANEASKGAWLALLLTIPARFSIPGPVPFWLIDANGNSAGKGLLTQLTSIITLGRKPFTKPGACDPDEFRKSIIGILREGQRMVWLEEVSSPFGGNNWNGLMTTTYHQDRILGVSKMWSGPHFQVWVATGNNVDLRSDTSRRCVHIRIQPSEERPEERIGFKYPDLLDHARQHRLELFNHVLTILRAYHLAGQPKHGLTPLGSFEAWSDLVRECVYWCTGIDCDTHRELTAMADPTREMSGVLIEQLAALFPGQQTFLASGIMMHYEAKGMDGRWANPELREALDTLNTNPKGVNSKGIGNLLRNKRERTFSGFVLKGNPGGKQGMTYRIVRVSGEAVPPAELKLPTGPMPDFPGLRGFGGSGGPVLPASQVTLPANGGDVSGGLEGFDDFGGITTPSGEGNSGTAGSGTFTPLSSEEITL